MENDRILDVEVQEDFVEKLAAARPAQALAELIWNGLDAEATRVTCTGITVHLDFPRFGSATTATELPLQRSILSLPR